MEIETEDIGHIKKKGFYTGQKKVSLEIENQCFHFYPGFPFFCHDLHTLPTPTHSSPKNTAGRISDQPGVAVHSLVCSFPQIRCLSHCSSSGVDTKRDLEDKSWKLSPNSCSSISKPPTLSLSCLCLLQHKKNQLKPTKNSSKLHLRQDK
jgi:hypothetical protein